MLEPPGTLYAAISETDTWKDRFQLAYVVEVWVQEILEEHRAGGGERELRVADLAGPKQTELRRRMLFAFFACIPYSLHLAPGFFEGKGNKNGFQMAEGLSQYSRPDTMPIKSLI